MSTLFNLVLLPLRAPMLLLLLLISTYQGLHWSRPGSLADSGLGGFTTLIWSAECLQALVVVVVCTVPELLMRRLASMMAASRVISLVVTLLLVITGGLYLLHLDVLSNVLILASAVLLARLDLVRLRVAPPPFVMTLILSVLVLGGISLGRVAEMEIRPYIAPPQATRAPASARRAPASARRAEPAAGGTAQAPQREATSATDVPDAPEGQAGDATKATSEASQPRVSGRVSPTPPGRAAATSRSPGASASRPQPEREPDRAVPHLQNSAGQADSP